MANHENITSENQTPKKIKWEAWQDKSPPQDFVNNVIQKIEVKEVPDCPVCECSFFSEYTIGFDYEIQTCSNPWRFVQCTRCFHVWLNPRPAISDLSVIYPPTYYAYNLEEQVHSIAIRGKAFLDEWKMRSVFRILGRRPNSYLDIGCGNGRFLRSLERKGIPRSRIYGLELDKKTVASLAEEGYQVFCERIENCSLIPGNCIDLATMFHVIEHVDEPFAVLTKVAQCLSPGGSLALETPNIDSIDARLFKRQFWGGYHFPRHWHLFTPESISKLLRKVGLRTESISFQTGHSFWMYSFHHLLLYREKPLRNLARLFDPIKSIPFLVAFTGLDKVRAALGFKTSAMFVIARKM